MRIHSHQPEISKAAMVIDHALKTSSAESDDIGVGQKLLPFTISRQS